MRSAIYPAIAITVFVFAAGAQDKPNFSGTWLLDTGKSDFGDLPVPSSQTNVIDHKGTSIDLTQTVTADTVLGGSATARRYYSTDGKETSADTGGSQLKFTAKWEGVRLLVNMKSDTPGGRTEIEDAWELKGTEGPLVITRHFKSDDGEHRQRLIFNKAK